MRPLLLLLLCACGSTELTVEQHESQGTAASSLNSPTAVVAWSNYLAENECADAHSLNCLAVCATASAPGSYTPVYCYRANASTDPSGANGFRPHQLLPYVKLLADAAASDPANFGPFLTGQLDFMFYDTALRNGARVFENKYGIADAMTQAEYALFLHRYANQLRDRHDARADDTEQLSLAFARALELPAGPRTGGVRGPESQCGPDNAHRVTCFFLQSLAGEDITTPGAALDEHLTALRDAATLRNLTGNPKLEAVVIGALMQLTYGKAGPTLQRFLDPQGTYWFAFYELNVNGVGQNVSRTHTCQAFTHDLQLISDISDRLDGAIWPANAYHARRGLLGVGLPSERLGQHPTQNPVLQLWLTQSHANVFTGLEHCPAESLPTAVTGFYDAQYP